MFTDQLFFLTEKFLLKIEVLTQNISLLEETDYTKEHLNMVFPPIS